MSNTLAVICQMICSIEVDVGSGLGLIYSQKSPVPIDRVLSLADNIPLDVVWCSVLFPVTICYANQLHGNSVPAHTIAKSLHNRPNCFEILEKNNTCTKLQIV